MYGTLAINNARSSARAPRHLIAMPYALGAFLAAHVLAAPFMRAYPIIALGHAVATLGFGLIYAATTRRIRRVSYVVAYIAGAEVLWRMTKAGVFWEFGKYAVAAILLVALGRIRSHRNRSLALAYFGLLLPSALLTLTTLDLAYARSEISFNLSGPFAIAIAVVFFSNIRLTREELSDTFFALLGPILGIAAISFLSTRSHVMEFFNASNTAASGGFGPNQVSSILGVGVLVLVLLSFDRTLVWRARTPLLLLAILLAVQCALTFARGGLLLAFIGAGCALLFLIRGNARMRITILLVLTITGLLGKYVIEPRLDEFTGGKLAQRYTSTKSSGRTLFMQSELDLFKDHPVLGVGPGVGMQLRNEPGLFAGASHTEYTRMLAEHGVLGVLSLCCLVALGVRAVRRARLLESRAFATALVMWAAMFLLIYGIRLVAPAVVFGLAFALRTPPQRRVAATSLTPA